jgi:hypothetical protein
LTRVEDWRLRTRSKATTAAAAEGLERCAARVSGHVSTVTGRYQSAPRS